MKEKDLLKAIGQIDEKYIDQAMEYQPRKKFGFVKWITVALCLSLIIKYWPLKPMSDSPKGKDGEMLFDYGPIYPLRGDGEDNDLLVERELHFDFINNDYSANITDSYIINNTSSKDITFKGIYPSVNCLDDSNVLLSKIKIDGHQLDSMIKTDINHQEIPVYDQTVKVLKINSATILENYTVCDLHIHFDYNPAKTKILSAYSYLPLIRGGVIDEDNLYDYFYQIHKGAINENYFIIIGDDITSYTIDAYEYGSMSKYTKTVEADVDSQFFSTSLNQVLDEIVEQYFEQRKMYDHKMIEMVDQKQLKELFYLSLQEDHILDISHHRDSDYCGMFLYNNLDKIITDQRLLFTLFEVLIPANSSITVEIDQKKYGNIRSGQGKYYEYDFFTKEGSELNFTKQFVSVKCKKNEIVSNNCGLDLDKGIDRVELDLDQDSYYIQVHYLYGLFN